jgi:hypothetical protein
MVSQFVGPVSGGYVYLYDYQVGVVVQSKGLYVFVLDFYLIVFIEIAGQCCQAKRREEGIFDRPEKRAFGFGQGG